MHACMLSHCGPVWLFETLWTIAHKSLLSPGFSRQEYWSGLPCLPPEDLPNPGIEPTSVMSPALEVDSLPLAPPGNYCSIQFSHSLMSNSLRPHGLQHTRPPCPSPTPGACSDFMSIELVIPSTHLILCCPLLLLLSIFPSIRVFSNESVLCITWPKYWSLCISISPSTEYLGLISFRMDCFYFLAVQGILKSLLQHRSSKASILWCQLSL